MRRIISGVLVLTTVGLAAPPAFALDGPWSTLAANLESPLSRLLLQLLVILAVARVIGGAFTRIGLPAVVGEMAAGIVLGPSLFGALSPGLFALVFPAGSLGGLQLFAQVGVCLFMFSVGMELSLAQLKREAPVVLAVSHASIAAPFLLGVLLAWPLFAGLAGPNATYTSFALFMAVSMSITAFPVLARILKERGLTRTPLGRMAITCAAAGDVTAWVILAFVAAIAGAAGLGSAALTLTLMALFVAVMLLAVRPALPALLGSRALSQAEPSSRTIALVLLVVVASALFTEVIGIHALFGAFLAGAVMPSVEGFRERIDARIEKLSSVLLLPLFFAFTGLRTRIDLLDGAGDLLICGLIIAVATAGKLGASALGARLAGMRWRDSLQMGALMNTRGLMELIVLNMGYDMGILGPRIFTMLVIMALATTVMTGPLLTLFARAEEQRAEGGAAELQ